MKSVKWGHVWKKSSEPLGECVEMFWPTMGKGWTVNQCFQDIQTCKRDGTIGQASKPIIYEVILRPVWPTPTDPAPEGWPHFSEIAHQPMEDSDYERGVCDGKHAAYYQLRSRRDRLVEALRAEAEAASAIILDRPPMNWDRHVKAVTAYDAARAHRIAVQEGKG